MARLQRHGFSDAESVGLAGAVGLNVLRNYFNLVLDTDLDAPLVRTGEAIASAARA